MKAVSEYVSPGVRRASTLVAYKATADIVSKAVTLLVTVAAARVLAPQAFGILALAMTTGWLLGVASDAGLPLYLARALAGGHAPAGAVMRSVMRLRARLAVGALAAGVLIALAWAPSAFVLAFALIVTAQIAGAVLETLAHVYRGLGRSDIESTLVIAQRLFAGGLASAVLIARPSLLLLSVALVVPPVSALVVSLAIAARLTRRASAGNAELPFTLEGFRRDAAPIGLGILVSAIYFRCDVYFLNYWHGLEAVGAYNAVFRLVEALRLFPAAVLAVAFPELCRAATLRPVRRLSVVLIAAGVLAMAVTVAAAPGIVHVTYGPAYDHAAAPLQVPRARGAAIFSELRAHAPSDRVGRPAALSRNYLRSAPRQRRRKSRADPLGGHARRRLVDGAHRIGGHRGLRTLAPPLGGDCGKGIGKGVRPLFGASGNHCRKGV